MVLTGGRVVNGASNLVTNHNLETGEGAVQKLEKKTKEKIILSYISSFTIYPLQNFGVV